VLIDKRQVLGGAWCVRRLWLLGTCGLNILHILVGLWMLVEDQCTFEGLKGW
jgi:hypothetical protein